MGEKKKDKVYWLIIIILIIIILILLYFTRFGKIENKYLKPTGNVDIFDIDINIDSECSDDNDGDNVFPVWNEQTFKNELNKIYINDKNGNYVYQQNLNIFKNAFYEYTNKIAPGVFNTYYFVVHNSSNMNVKYYVEMYENTNYDINIKYRLKRNGNYIIGDKNKWVTANELKTTFEKLNMKDSDKFSLDWKWDYESGDDEKDTYIGENVDGVYKLNIRFYFEQVQ